MLQPRDDLSWALVALDQRRTLMAVVELSFGNLVASARTLSDDSLALFSRHSYESRNPLRGLCPRPWVPAFAGMTLELVHHQCESEH
jgi:hypothetical protein